MNENDELPSDDMTPNERSLWLIRQRDADRKAGGQVLGVRDWIDISFLLFLLDEQTCKNCKKEIEENL